MWFPCKHDCLKVLSEVDEKIHKELYDLSQALDKTIKEETFIDVWTLQYYDENEWNTYVEIYTDEHVAKERFYEVMKSVFEYELKELKDMDWKNVYDFENNQFYFKKDAYHEYYSVRWAKWIYTDDWKYPRNTWKCWLLDYYSGLMLKKTKVNKPFIFVKED